MPRSYQFLDEIFERSYETFGKVNQAFAALAAVALLISMIGLLGMAVQIANRRVHEIGVRKTLGASTGQVVRMLLLDIGKPVLIANVIAWPLGYVAAHAYLSIFMHRIIVTPAPFLLTLLFTVLIAVLAVGGQALRAARVRPAEVLNSE
jgi:putative ABC transport system permease protein